MINLGFMPMAMLYRDESGKRDKEWQRFQGKWVNPKIVGYKMYNDNEYIPNKKIIPKGFF